MIKKCYTCGYGDWCIRKEKKEGKCKYWHPKVADEYIQEKINLEKLRMEQFGRVD